ncbi:MAG TPA: Spy/CpxP family protein refolding chaperone [Gemmatimonadales bacterium]|nr:Spy/CpxP family protein refolding chaperone [Gemmatimonadales bacterium]
MRFRYLLAFSVLFAPLSPLAAQGQDSERDRRADSLRDRIEERFAARVQEQLGLNNDQAARLRATSETFGKRRRELRERAQQLREALRQQLQPGVAANPDSVTKLTDALVDLKLTSAQAARDEMREYAKYLTPVQRARLLVMRERMYHHVKGAHGHGGRERRHRDRSWM